MFVTRQIWEFFNLEKIWENPAKLIPHAKLSFKNVSPSCYDIKFIQILSFIIVPWNPNQPLIVECVIPICWIQLGLIHIFSLQSESTNLDEKRPWISMDLTTRILTHEPWPFKLFCRMRWKSRRDGKLPWATAMAAASSTFTAMSNLNIMLVIIPI